MNPHHHSGTTGFQKVSPIPLFSTSFIPNAFLLLFSRRPIPGLAFMLTCFAFDDFEQCGHGGNFDEQCRDGI